MPTLGSGWIPAQDILNKGFCLCATAPPSLSCQSLKLFVPNSELHVIVVRDKHVFRDSREIIVPRHGKFSTSMPGLTATLIGRASEGSCASKRKLGMANRLRRILRGDL